MSYYEAHAKRCYHSVKNNVLIDAEKIVGLVRKKKLESRFKSADIYQNNHCGLSDTTRVNTALNFLRDMNYLVHEKIQGVTGKSAENWVVHPKLLDNT